jgi:TolA-binding protein
MKRNLGAIAFFLLLTPGAGFAASKEQQEMQRDIAQLQDQVRTLQSGFDQQMATLKTLVEQALDAANKNNTSVSVLSSSVMQTLDRELKDALRPVAGLTAKIDNANNDISDVRSSITDLTTQLNRIQQQLSDINNAIKVMQAPPAAPPPSNVNPDAAAVAPRSAIPPAKTLYDTANNDYTAGHADLALGDYGEFLRDYPDDPLAPEAQFFIGVIHLGQLKYDLAVTDFDAVLERYPEGKRTPDAYFMKGKALKSAGHRDEAVTVWRALRKKYPRSDQADAAAEQLRAMGLSAGPAAPSARKK